ncbi:MAG TPA: hypothetical protein VFK82_02655 [Burkholderiaceae bacterium]|nr:hypothetical protein [Burkholderiaceae bacterium]
MKPNRIAPAALALASLTLATPASAQTACTAGTFDAAFGPASTGGFVPVGARLAFVPNSGGGNTEGLDHTGTGQIVTGAIGGADGLGAGIFNVARLTASGSIDPVYGGAGVVAPFGTPSDVPLSSSTQQTRLDASGNTIAVRVWGDRITVNRFSATGQPDFAYGANGAASVALTVIFPLVGLNVLANGSVLLATTAQNALNQQQAVVVKFTPSGLPDTTFGTAGIQWLSPLVAGGGTSILSRATDVLPLAGGQMLVAGRARGGPGPFSGFIARLNANGTLDTGFGSGGYAAYDWGGGRSTLVRKLALQSDGRIIAVGTALDISGAGLNSGVVMRVLANGALDVSYGAGGLTQITGPFGTNLFNVALQSNNKAIVSGAQYTAADFSTQAGLVARLTPGGSLDSVFGGSGVATYSVPGTSSTGGGALAIRGNRVAITSNVTYGSGNTSQFGTVVLRYDIGTGTGCR